MRTRMLGVVASAVIAVVVAYGVYQTCGEFFFVPGIDRCVPPPARTLAPYLVAAWAPSLVLSLQKRGSTIVLWIVYFLHVMSSVIVAPFFLGVGWPTLTFAVGVAGVFGLVGLSSWAFAIRLPKMRIGEAVLIYGLFFLALISAAAIWRTFPLRGSLPSLAEVYARRAEFKETIASSSSGALVYVILIASYSIAPLACVLGIACWHRKWYGRALLLLSSAALLSLLVFNAAAFKSVALLPWAVALAMAAFHAWPRNVPKTFVVLSGTAVVALLLVGLSDVGRFIFLQLFRRVFVSPGINTAYFFQYYGANAIVGVRDAPKVISEVYFGLQGSANSGLFGDGLARGGVLGVFINLAIFWGYLRMIDAVSTRMPMYLVGALFIPQAYALANSGTLTVLATYGLATSLVVAFMLNGSRGELWKGRTMIAEAAGVAAVGVQE